MGEIAINPTHNVHQKYRQMNLVNPYIFTPALTYNTFIGGVASTIGTASALATKLAIDVSRITNFSIVGSDIKCKITGSYVIPASCFDGDINIAHYKDLDGLVTDLENNAFRATKKIQYLEFKGIINSVGSEFCGSSKISEVSMPNAISVLNLPFMNSSNVVVVYIPRCTNLGGSFANNNTLNVINTQAVVYAHPSLATNNGGAPDGDLTGRIVRYVTNFTSPNGVSTLVAGTIYSRAVQLNFTPPSSTNAIDYYEVYNNGVFLNKISASGEYAKGLTASTLYNITIVAVDVFYNKSIVSNLLSVTTSASDDITTGLLSYYKLNSNSNDSFGNNNGVDTSITYGSGKVGNGAVFTSANNSKIIIGNSSAFAVNGNSSISFWIKPTSFAIRQNPFEYGSYTSWGSLNLFQDGQLSFYYTPLNSGGFLNPNTGANKLTLNQWVHVVLVRNYANNTIKIYFNSVEVMNHTTTGTGANPSSGDAVIGKGYAGGGGALIDEFSIYNIALTQTQINSIYNAGNGTTL